MMPALGPAVHAAMISPGKNREQFHASLQQFHRHGATSIRIADVTRFLGTPI